MHRDARRRCPGPLAAVCLLVLVCAQTGILPAPVAHAQAHQITDCGSEYGGSGYSVTSPAPGTLAYAVGQGGSWTFSCSGTMAVTAAMTVPSSSSLVLVGGGTVSLDGGHTTQIFIVHGSLTISGLTLEDASVTDLGGAIYSDGTLTVEDSAFVGNLSSSNTSPFSGAGGAIYSLGTLVVRDSSFSDNSATAAGLGGAIYNGGSLTIAGSTFSGNSVSGSSVSASSGGAILNDGTMVVSGSTFSGNTAANSGGEGGAVSNDDTANLTVTTSTFRGNLAVNGAAIASSGTLLVAGDTFTGNRASNGGGAIFNVSPSMTVANSTFTGNSAAGSGGRGGGAILNGGFDFPVVVNSTISGNSASQGANIYGNGLTLKNAIVANPAGGGQDCYLLPGGYATERYAATDSLESDASCGTPAPGGWTEGDPDLGPLAANGGPTQTMAIEGTSASDPALGRADATVCAQPPVDGFDQRGVARGVTATTCDIGAYQATVPPAADLAAQYVVQPLPVAPPGSLSPTQTVAVSVYTETYAGGAAPNVPVYMWLSGGTGAASVGGIPLTPAPQRFTSDGNGHVAVQYTAGTPAVAGADTIQVADAAASPTLQASDSYTYPNPQLVLVPPVQAGEASSPGRATIGPLQVELETGGTAVRAAAAVTVTLASSSGSGVFATSSGGTPTESVTIPAGSTGANFYYGDSVPGTQTLTASAGAARATQQVAVVSADGSGSMAVSPGSVAAGSVGDTLTFTYTAAPGGLSGGEVELTVPAGWSAPTAGNIALTAGTLGAITGSGPWTVPVTGVSLMAGQTLTITYSGAAAPAVAAAETFPVFEASTAAGTPAALAASPVVTVTATAGGGRVFANMPVVAGISPDSGPAAGASSVTITGSYLAGATAVLFGGMPAAGFTVDSDAQITAISPAGSGTVDVRVTTAAGTSASGAADRFTYRVPVTVTVPVAPAFSDVPSSYWAFPYIEALAGKGVINGFPDDTFRPDGPVTRAQFVKMLVLTLGLQPSAAPTPFTDLAPDAWYTTYVSSAVRAGIVDGTTATTFAPDAPLTREQMAVLVARALRLTRTVPLHFTDAAAIDAWALPGVEETVAAGYIDGFPNGSLDPLGATTRAQAAKVLAMVLQHLGT